MTDLEIFESLCPDVEPLSELDRARVRLDLFGNETTSGSPDTMPVAVAGHDGLDRGVVRSDTRQARSGGWLLSIAATCLLAVGVAAVWFTIGSRQAAEPAPAQQPFSTAAETTPDTESTGATVLPAEPGESTEPVPEGALILDRFPTALADAHGYTYVGSADLTERPLPADTWVQRWYTAATDQPELRPHLKLASTSATQQFPPEIPPPGTVADGVTVRGNAAWLYDDPVRDGRVVAFEDDEMVFVLTGYQVSDDELLRAAEGTILADSDSVGAVIDAGALPDGLGERGVGATDESGFLSLETRRNAPASVRWYNAQPDGALPGDSEPMLWLGWRPEDPDMFPLHRLEYDTVTDTTVHGVPAFVATNTNPGYIGITWSENGNTYSLGGWGLDPDTVLAAANRLRPPTATEWNALEVEPG